MRTATSQRRPGRITAIIVAASVVMVGALLGTCALNSANRASERARLAGRHREAVREFLAEHHERPVLRGAPLPGSSTRAIQAALTRFRDWGPPANALSRALANPTPAEGRPDAIDEAIASQRDAIAALRGATQHLAVGQRFAFVEPDALPNYVELIRAAKLLLVLGLRSEPSECLRVAADAVRVGHDMVPGGGLIAHMLATAIVFMASGVAVRCAEHASHDQLAAAHHELRQLARDAPSFAHTMRFEMLYEFISSRDRALRPLGPFDLGALDYVLQGGDVLDGMSEALSLERQWRAPRLARYRAAMVLIDQMARGSQTGVFGIDSDFPTYVRRAAAGEARLRASAILMTAIAESPDRNCLPLDPPAALFDPQLSEPVTGAPLRYLPQQGRIAWSIQVEADSDAHAYLEIPGARRCGRSAVRTSPADESRELQRR